MNIKISPSILSADFANLGQEASAMKDAGAALLHVDVMDGHFVPNITIGPPVVASLRAKTDLILDVHLMITNPFDYIAPFVQAGADMITFHLESDSDPAKTIDEIHRLGVQAGVAIKPSTSVEAVLPFLDLIDMVLIMTVEPGFGGQSFLPETLSKVAAVRAANAQIDIQVDGGINAQTARLASEAGANVLVAGSYIFGSPDPAQAVFQLKQL